MTPTQHQLYRQSLLLQLEAAYPGALPVTTLQQGLAFAGHLADRATLDRELAHLSERSLIVREDAFLLAGLARFRITADGRDSLAVANLL